MATDAASFDIFAEILSILPSTQVPPTCNNIDNCGVAQTKAEASEKAANSTKSAQNVGAILVTPVKSASMGEYASKRPPTHPYPPHRDPVPPPQPPQPPKQQTPPHQPTKKQMPPRPPPHPPQPQSVHSAAPASMRPAPAAPRRIPLGSAGSAGRTPQGGRIPSMSLLDAEIDEEAEFGPDIVGLDESVLQAVIAPAPVAGYRRESHIPHTASIGPLHAVTPLTDTSPTPTLPCIESTVAATQPPAAEPFPGGTPFPAEIANLELDGAVPEPFRSGVFGAYAVLNAVQSRVFDAVFHSDMNVAVAAPTGCGKTAIFELAITRLLLQTQYAESSSDDLEQPLPWDATPPGMSSLDSGHLDAAPVVPSVPRSKIRGKVVYLSPLKALCTERLEDWRAKFGRLGGGAQSITIGGGMMQFGGATGGNGYGSGVVQHPQYSNLDLNVVCWTGDSEESADSGDGTGALETDEGQAFQTQEGSSDRLKNGKKRRFSHSSKLLVDADLIITTPEKWDSLTRRWKDNIGVIGAIELLLIDEVHMVGAEEGGKTQAGEPGGTYSGVGEADESEQEAQRLESGSSSERGNGSSGSSRGGVLEAVVSRMRAVASSADVRRKGWPASRLRTVAVSATVPNIHDIGDWIGATPSSTFAFGSNYRPVPLTIHFLGYDYRGNGFMFERFLDSKVYEVIIAYSPAARPTLVFCASRNGAKNCAESIIKQASLSPQVPTYGGGNSRARGSSTATWPNSSQSTPFSQQLPQSQSWGAQMWSSLVRDNTHYRKLQSLAASVNDSRLAQCLRSGVGYHHAGHTAKDRSLVEKAFIAGDLPVLCTTTTLALGVNLPAHLVVVKSTQAWRGGAAGYQEYPRATLLQMMGRAGRPQFDTEGVVVLMTQSHTRDMYMRALSSPRGLELPPLESSLPSSLVEHLASEICIGTIRTLQEALQWLRSTFMSIRMMKNPVHYGLTPAGDLTAMRRTVLQHLRAVLVKHLFALYRAKCIRLSRLQDPGTAQPPPMGSAHIQSTAVELHPSSIPELISAIRGDTVSMVASGPARVIPGPSRPPGAMNVEQLLEVQPCSPIQVMTRGYIRFETIELFGRTLTAMSPSLSYVEVLRALCSASEFESMVVIRRDEKKYLREVKEKLGYVKHKKGPDGKVATVPDKVFQLVQIVLGRLKLEAAGQQSYFLRMEATAITQLLRRICQAFVSYCACPEIMSAFLPHGLIVQRSLDRSLWADQPAERLLLQFEGITEALLPLLGAAGIRCIADLQAAKVNAISLEAACRKRPPFGNQIVTAVTGAGPKFFLDAWQKSQVAGAGAASAATIVIRVSTTARTSSEGPPNSQGDATKDPGKDSDSDEDLDHVGFGAPRKRPRKPTSGGLTAAPAAAKRRALQQPPKVVNYYLSNLLPGSSGEPSHQSSTAAAVSGDITSTATGGSKGPKKLHQSKIVIPSKNQSSASSSESHEAKSVYLERVTDIDDDWTDIATTHRDSSNERSASADGYHLIVTNLDLAANGLLFQTKLYGSRTISVSIPRPSTANGSTASSRSVPIKIWLIHSRYHGFDAIRTLQVTFSGHGPQSATAADSSDAKSMPALAMPRLQQIIHTDDGEITRDLDDRISVHSPPDRLMDTTTGDTDVSGRSIEHTDDLAASSMDESSLRVSFISNSGSEEGESNRRSGMLQNPSDSMPHPSRNDSTDVFLSDANDPLSRALDFFSSEPTPIGTSGTEPAISNNHGSTPSSPAHVSAAPVARLSSSPLRDPEFLPVPVAPLPASLPLPPMRIDTTVFLSEASRGPQRGPSDATSSHTADNRDGKRPSKGRLDPRSSIPSTPMGLHSNVPHIDRKEERCIDMTQASTMPRHASLQQRPAVRLFAAALSLLSDHQRGKADPIQTHSHAAIGRETIAVGDTKAASRQSPFFEEESTPTHTHSYTLPHSDMDAIAINTNDDSHNSIPDSMVNNESRLKIREVDLSAPTRGAALLPISTSSVAAEKRDQERLALQAAAMSTVPRQRASHMPSLSDLLPRSVQTSYGSQRTAAHGQGQGQGQDEVTPTAGVFEGFGKFRHPSAATVAGRGTFAVESAILLSTQAIGTNLIGTGKALPLNEPQSERPNGPAQSTSASFFSRGDEPTRRGTAVQALPSPSHLPSAIAASALTVTGPSIRDSNNQQFLRRMSPGPIPPAELSFSSRAGTVNFLGAGGRLIGLRNPGSALETAADGKAKGANPSFNLDSLLARYT